jgi:glutamyl-tRNA reductase
MDVSEVGKLHIETDKQKELLTAFKNEMKLDELMFLSTCNRVEFLFTTKEDVDANFLFHFFKKLYHHYEPTQIDLFVETAELHSGIQSIAHILQVASSIDSMIVGEREIITQVRNAFEASKSMGLT